MVQWWKHLPPTTVTWVPFQDPPSSVGLVCWWFSFLLWGFFSRSSSFPPSPKTNISNSNLVWKQLTGRATLWKCPPLNYCYIIIIIVIIIKHGLEQIQFIAIKDNLYLAPKTLPKNVCISCQGPVYQKSL